MHALAARADCAAVIAIGQCATFGGYPACIGPDLQPKASGTKNQTGAMGTAKFLARYGLDTKVINVPGCPTNPWWFILTVVAWLVDANQILLGNTPPLGILGAGLAIQPDAVDRDRRLKAVYGNLLHGKYCPRYQYYAARQFADRPGDPGCLKNIGCKGLYTNSLCGRRGWNAQNPKLGAGFSAAQDAVFTSPTDSSTKIGGFCITAGHPCMGCTENGYPDAFSPFVIRK